jgi:hypothetical protein
MDVYQLKSGLWPIKTSKPGDISKIYVAGKVVDDNGLEQVMIVDFDDENDVIDVTIMPEERAKSKYKYIDDESYELPLVREIQDSINEWFMNSKLIIYDDERYI